ncbi:glycogen biosynthesis protein GlgD [Bacillus mangrovi]|uniref:Glycogen biosynthesis protein GlgD n=1 Tax=Metabacillus mangrovi TaxID=1491830 RepID=A0A7X2S806_9BACI|nr:glycogen biosynthesis protein GlgD [Metabacillus mangrovi]MTH54486.1 glycogen biosynthesis protein GlgD [Metabacillus mangrovi]
MATKSDQNNPEQKTHNAGHPEFANEMDPVAQVKKKNAKRSQPDKSK